MSIERICEKLRTEGPQGSDEHIDDLAARLDAAGDYEQHWAWDSDMCIIHAFIRERTHKRKDLGWHYIKSVCQGS